MLETLSKSCERDQSCDNDKTSFMSPHYYDTKHLSNNTRGRFLSLNSQFNLATPNKECSPDGHLKEKLMPDFGTKKQVSVDEIKSPYDPNKDQIKDDTYFDCENMSSTKQIVSPTTEGAKNITSVNINLGGTYDRRTPQLDSTVESKERSISPPTKNMQVSSSKDLELFLIEEQRAQEEVLNNNALSLNELENIIKNNAKSKYLST
jgi:hypothetical protein